MSNMEKFLATLPIMLQGMIGIFFVLAAIYLVIYVLNKVTNKAPKQDEGADTSANNQ